MADETPPQEIPSRRGAPVLSCRGQCVHSKAIPQQEPRLGWVRGLGEAQTLLHPLPKAQPLPGALELWGIRSKQDLQSKMSLEVALRGLLSFGSNRHQIQSQLDAQRWAQLLLGPLVAELHFYSRGQMKWGLFTAASFPIIFSVHCKYAEPALVGISILICCSSSNQKRFMHCQL